jgi:hypothetical protein
MGTTTVMNQTSASPGSPEGGQGHCQEPRVKIAGSQGGQCLILLLAGCVSGTCQGPGDSSKAAVTLKLEFEGWVGC